MSGDAEAIEKFYAALCVSPEDVPSESWAKCHFVIGEATHAVEAVLLHFYTTPP
jgi:hypothetical protein